MNERTSDQANQTTCSPHGFAFCFPRNLTTKLQRVPSYYLCLFYFISHCLCLSYTWCRWVKQCTMTLFFSIFVHLDLRLYKRIRIKCNHLFTNTHKCTPFYFFFFLTYCYMWLTQFNAEANIITSWCICVEILYSFWNKSINYQFVREMERKRNIWQKAEGKQYHSKNFREARSAMHEMRVLLMMIMEGSNGNSDKK